MCNQRLALQDSLQSQSIFEELDDPKLAGHKSWKERLVEGALILPVSVAVIGVLIYAFIAIV